MCCVSNNLSLISSTSLKHIKENVAPFFSITFEGLMVMLLKYYGLLYQYTSDLVAEVKQEHLHSENARILNVSRLEQ